MNIDHRLVYECHAGAESGRILQAGVEDDATLVKDGAQNRS